MKSRTTRNVMANFGASIWTAFTGLAFVPLYIAYLGIEAYGVIGLYTSLQAWFLLLDSGLGATLNREMARFRAGAHSPQSIHELLLSIRRLILAAALVIAVACVAMAPWLASNWLQPASLDRTTVAYALGIAGVTIAFRFVGGLYRNAMLGLQEQVALQGSNVVFATLRGLGAVAVLAWVSATLEAFFVFQGLVALAELIVLHVLLLRLLPEPATAPRFSWQSVAGIRRYTAGVFAVVLFSTLLVTIDKLLLARLLPLEQFGHYILASTVNVGLYALISPVNAAAAPRFAELVARGDEATVRATYHRFCQLAGLVAVPAALTMSLFSDHLMLLWTQSQALTSATAPLVTVIAFGSAINALVAVPHYLQLAHGWTRLPATMNAVAVALMLAAIGPVALRYGALGAAWMWVSLNVGYMVFGMTIMHRHILRGDLRRWYFVNTLPPVAAVAAVLFAVRAVAPAAQTAGPLGHALTLLAASSLAMAAAAASLPLGREMYGRALARAGWVG